ncbi:peptide chain release factor 1 [Humitalea sp. 24SJ18S-53]|uniref:peptide chain release factor 1 n=1 Tax=Humitalea sp. 24SJ18S-53 TaxID=3422307 RepID=UPI003D67A23D
MNQQERDRKIAELETLLNDPAIRMDPERIWSLLAEVSGGLGPAPPVKRPAQG